MSRGREKRGGFKRISEFLSLNFLSHRKIVFYSSLRRLIRFHFLGLGCPPTSFLRFHLSNFLLVGDESERVGECWPEEIELEFFSSRHEKVWFIKQFFTVRTFLYARIEQQQQQLDRTSGARKVENRFFTFSFIMHGFIERKTGSLDSFGKESNSKQHEQSHTNFSWSSCVWR